jgi:hypothetical protein
MFVFCCPLVLRQQMILYLSHICLSTAFLFFCSQLLSAVSGMSAANVFYHTAVIASMSTTIYTFRIILNESIISLYTATPWDVKSKAGASRAPALFHLPRTFLNDAEQPELRF